jgi:hypothetical protein
MKVIRSLTETIGAIATRGGRTRMRPQVLLEATCSGTSTKSNSVAVTLSCCRHREVAYPHQVVGGQREDEIPVHSGESAVSDLPRHPDGRLVRRQPQRELTPLTPFRQRAFKARQGVLRFEQHPPRLRRLGPLTLAFLRLRPSRQAGKLAGRTADAALGLLDRAMEISRDPERVARRVSVRLLSRALPGPMRSALWLARGVASIGVRERW